MSNCFNIQVNFDELKYNLYELLNVDMEASCKKIKKAYRKIIMKYHPDKNNTYDDDIYNHLTLANQFLTNDEIRQKYDEWLKTTIYTESHSTLKENYNNKNKEPTKEITKEELSTAKEKYNQVSHELDKKHTENIKIDENNDSIMINYEKLKNEKIIIEKQDIKDKDEFNNFFEKKKNSIEISCDKINDKISEYNSSIVGNTYSLITNYDMLYSEDNIDSKTYSSLDKAFVIQPKIEFNEENVEEKMINYKNMSRELSNLKI